MNSLLLVAHGSRRQASNNAVKLLAQQIGKRQGHHFQLVEAAFLELAEPSIPDGIQSCIAQGADDVLVVPYFLAAGRHVSQDIPEIVQQAQQDNPNTTINMSAYLGASDVMIDLILQMAETTKCIECQRKDKCDYPSCVLE